MHIFRVKWYQRRNIDIASLPSSSFFFLHFFFFLYISSSFYKLCRTSKSSPLFNGCMYCIVWLKCNLFNGDSYLQVFQSLLQMAAVASVCMSTYMCVCICKLEVKRLGQSIYRFLSPSVNFFGNYE